MDKPDPIVTLKAPDGGPPREVSLFTGAGGGVLGTGLLGIDHVAYCEWSEFPQEVLKARMADGSIPTGLLHDDVQTFDGKPWQGKAEIVSAGFPCFVAGTLVLTRDGFRPIESLQVGDQVLTHQGRWRQITATMIRDDATLRRIKAQGVPGVVTTDEHPFLVRSRKSRNRGPLGEMSWLDAAKVTVTNHVAQVVPPTQEDGHTEAFWWLVGRYLADGWRVDRLDRATESGRVVVCANFEEGDEVAKRIVEAGLHATPAPERTVIKFHITNTEFYKFLDRFGRGAHGKRIPDIALGLEQKKAVVLLSGYFTGDGHNPVNPKSKAGTRTWESTTVSKSLALGIALLAQRAYGVVATIKHHVPPPTKLIEGRLCNQSPFWTISVPERNRSAVVEGIHGWKKVKKNEPAGTGRVYNIAVEEDESYVADGAVVHNCQPFSVAGEQKAEGDPRNMWPSTVRIVSEVQPRLAFLENVPGLLSLKHGYFKVVLKDMAARGWTMVWDCIPMQSVGAPHRRDRLWMLAIPDGRDPSELPLLAVVQPKGRVDLPLMQWPTPVASDTGARQGSEKWIGSDLVSTVADVEFATGRIDKAQACLNPDWVEWLMSWPISWTAPILNDGALAQWRAGLTTGSWWDVEPSIPRIGPSRKDLAGRLKAVGNGQGSLAAAAAFESLYRALPEAVRHAEWHLAGNHEVVNFGGDDETTPDDQRRMAMRVHATWHPELHDGLAWLDPENNVRQMVGESVNYTDSWPTAGLLHKGQVWHRLSDTSDVSRPLDVLCGRHMVQQSEIEPDVAARMFATPVAYDANPGGPNNHYPGLGHQARHGNLNGATKADRVNEVAKRRQIARDRQRQKVQGPRDESDDLFDLFTP